MPHRPPRTLGKSFHYTLELEGVAYMKRGQCQEHALAMHIFVLRFITLRGNEITHFQSLVERIMSVK